MIDKKEGIRLKLTHKQVGEIMKRWWKLGDRLEEIIIGVVTVGNGKKIVPILPKDKNKCEKVLVDTTITSVVKELISKNKIRTLKNNAKSYRDIYAKDHYHLNAYIRELINKELLEEQQKQISKEEKRLTKEEELNSKQHKEKVYTNIRIGVINDVDLDTGYSMYVVGRVLDCVDVEEKDYHMNKDIAFLVGFLSASLLGGSRSDYLENLFLSGSYGYKLTLKKGKGTKELISEVEENINEYALHPQNEFAKLRKIKQELEG